MVTTLTLPALAFLMAISGIPGLNALPWFKSLVRHKPHAAVVDTLPPRWKPASLVALEPSFMVEGVPEFGRVPWEIQINTAMDPRQVKNTVEPDSGYWSSRVEVGEITLGTPVRRPLADFGTVSMSELFASKWRDSSRQKVNTGLATGTATHTGLSLPIPVQLPSVVTSLLGPGGPALNVSGSESIRLSGTSDWTNQQIGILGAKRSLFPSLDMQQDLNIQLEGQLSDRVKVNLLQNSANQVPLANLIAIDYKGEEDDLVQELALGNTSLSLPGTQYVSYSGRNEGLFGIKLAMRLGPLDFTALASKQEGKSERASYSGGASLSSHTLADLDYDKGRYFLLYDPQYALLKIDDASIQIYRDDANYGNDVSNTRALAMVDPDFNTGVPRNAVSDTAAFRGNFDLLHPIDDYDILSNYYVLPNGLAIKIIRLKSPLPVNSEMCLAASFSGIPVDGNGNPTGQPAVQVGGEKIATGQDAGSYKFKMLRPPHSFLKSQDPSNSNATFDTTSTFDAVRELEMKNFYQLPGFQIDPNGFKLNVQKGSDVPPVDYARLPDGTSVNYIEVLGLDNYDESQATRVKGHDEKVDGSAYTSGAQLFIDYSNGVLWFPDPRPFAPRIGQNNLGSRWFDQLMNANLNRRISMTGPGDSLNASNDFYDLYNPIPSQATRYYIVTTFAAQRGGGDITLGRGNILAGSDVVTVNGERWTRDRDYTIDYDLGHVTLKRNLGSTDQLNIDYSYAPLFAQASKTLIGSAFTLAGRDLSLGGAFLYESQGAQDLRPRLGEEPSRTLITDLNTDWKLKPAFLTTAIDHLPGIHTTTPSDMEIQAEVGASLPNPNTMNQVYIDDMEGVRDAVSLSLDPSRWLPMSVPSRITPSGYKSLLALDQDHSASAEIDEWNAELHWYNPSSTDNHPIVEEHDLKPNLNTDALGGTQSHNVLSLSVPRLPTPTGGVGPADTAITNPRILGPSEVDSVWAGLTYQIDDKGIDISRSQFIEIWVNDFNDRHDPGVVDGLVRKNHLRMHLDLGVVSEDQMRAPNRPPDGVLNSEDRVPRDHQLTLAEDTGYDGITSSDEQVLLRSGELARADLVTASDADPEGDDWQTVLGGYQGIDPRRYLYTNGTEGNKTQFPYPNTEDLNLNDNLDTAENYYEYTVDMGDPTSPYLVDDVQRDFPGNAFVPIDNGWRRYRIPLDDKLRQQFGSPDLTIARHVRLWFDGLKGADPRTASIVHPLLEIGSVDIVGSRWLSADLSPAQKDTLATTQTLNTVNSQDNADIYVAPFDPGNVLNSSQSVPRREQSLSLEFTNLAASDTLEAYRTFSIDEDYSRYGTLTWYMAAYGIQGFNATADTLLYSFVRFSSDELGQNYYELKRRLPTNSSPLNIHWDQIVADMKQISGFKLNKDFPQSGDVLYRAQFGPAGDSLIIVGRPSFTRLRRISFGLLNQYPGPALTGRTFSSGQIWLDEMRATDVAKTVGYADRLLLNGHMANVASYNVAWNSQDANFQSVGQTQGSGSTNTSLAMTSTVNPDKFFEGTGIQLPVSMVYNRNVSKPRFTAGDDVVRTGAQQDASETSATTRSISTSYTRTWSDRSNPFLRYTIGGLAASASRSRTDNLSPTGVSQSVSNAAAVNWGMSPRKLLVFGLPGTKAKFYPLPDRVYANYNWNSSHSFTSTRDANNPDQLVPSSFTAGHVAGLSIGADSRPFDLLQHHIDATRSLSLTGVGRNDYLGGIDIGRTTAWRQNFAAHYTAARGPWLQPNLTWSSNFSTAADLQSPDLSVHNASNGQSMQVNWTLPFDQLARKSKTTGGAQAAPTPPPAQAPPPRAKAREESPPRPKRARRSSSLTDDSPPAPKTPSAVAPTPADSTAKPSPADTTAKPAPGDTTSRSAPPTGTGTPAIASAAPGAITTPGPVATPSPGLPATTGAPALATAAPGATTTPGGTPTTGAGTTPGSAPTPASTMAPPSGAAPAVPVNPGTPALFAPPAPGAASTSGPAPVAGSARTAAAKADSQPSGPATVPASAAAATPAAADTLPRSYGSLWGDSVATSVAGRPAGMRLDSLALAGRPAHPDSSALAAGRPDTSAVGSRGHEHAARGLDISWRDFVSRVGNLQTDMTLNRSSSYSRLLGLPSFLYALGIVDDPGLSAAHHRVDLDPANSTTTEIDWRANARSHIPLVFGSAVSLRASVGDRLSTSNGVATRTQDSRFPDLDFEYGHLADVVHLTRFLQQPTIRTSWVHSNSTDYRGTSTTVAGRSSSDDFHPLLALRGNMRSGTVADLSVNVRNTLREIDQFGTSTTTDNNTDVNFTLSRNYSAGQKIKVLGKSKTIRTSGSLQLATVYSQHTGQTITNSSDVATRFVNDTRLSVTGTGNYGFSSNVNGSAVLGFTQTHDHTIDNIHRSVRVELRASFTF